MVVLIADSFESSGIEALRKAGCEIVSEPSLQGDALRQAILDTQCRVLVVRSTKVTAEMLESRGALALVVRAGAGVNTIDIAAASRHSVLVANCPGKNAIAVAELTFALILGLDRRLVENVTDLRRGVWNKKEYVQAAGLKGRTLGIVGMGEIGKAVARRARAFKMNVVAWSRSLTEKQADAMGVERAESPAKVAEQCRILTVHVAAAPETKRLINADVLGRLAPGSMVINTSRAEVMDYKALARAVKERGLRVGLDVFPDEPSGSQGEFADPIVGVEGIVYGTHHIGASTAQAQEAIAAETVDIVLDYFRTGRVRNCVNLAADTKSAYTLVVRHLNKPGVLAHTLNLISLAGVNVAEMSNVICEGMESACALIKLDAPLEEEVVSRIETGNEHVLGVSFFKVAE